MKEWICEEVPAVNLDGKIVSTMTHKIKELVRCKDCKWHDNADDSPKYLPCMEMRTNPNWFCADGEHA